MGLHVFLILFMCPLLSWYWWSSHLQLDTPQWLSFFLSFFISFYLQPPGIFTNGLLDLEPPAKVNPLPPAEGGPALTLALPHLIHTRNTVSTR